MKSKHNHHQHQNVTTQPAAPSQISKPSSADEISAKAYELYLKEGCPEGRALDHWCQAEASINGPTRARA